MSNRGSGTDRSIIKDFEGLENKYADLIKPYSNFREEYAEMQRKIEEKNSRAHICTHFDFPELFYVCFAVNRDIMVAGALRYFKEVLTETHRFTKGCTSFPRIRSLRVPEWDKYYFIDKKVPIAEILKYGRTLPCSNCGKYNFNHDDLLKKKCYIVENDGDIFEFAKGKLLCPECFGELGG